MKGSKSQISIAIVCALLGFLLTYQYKALTNSENKLDSSNKSDLISEIDSLKNQKAELEKTNAHLSEELKELEEAATKEGQVGVEVKKELDTARMYLGLVPVKGPGVQITITPKTSLFGSSDVQMVVSDQELVHLTNSLWYAQAEAISINGYRITPQTGIRNSGNYIWIGSEGRINPKEPIVIKAIGNKAKLNAALNFVNTLDFGALQNYDSKVEQLDNILIEKSTQTLKSDYLLNVEEKEEDK